MAHTPGLTAESTTTVDNLIAGLDVPLLADQVTYLTGTAYKRGDLLGVVTASGKYKVSASASSDGSQTPVAVCAEDVDATSADKLGPAYFEGAFSERAVIFGTGHTAASTRTALRDRKIFLRNSVKA